MNRHNLAGFAALICIFLVTSYVVGWILILISPYVDVLAIHGSLPLVLMGLIVATMIMGKHMRSDDEEKGDE